MNCVNTSTEVSDHVCIRTERRIFLSGIILVDEESWRNCSWISDSWWRHILFCRRALLRTDVKGFFFPIPRGCAATGCQLKKLICGSSFILVFQWVQQKLPPISLNIWLCSWWGHDDWERGNGRHTSLLPLVRSRMVCKENASGRCGGWQATKPWRRHRAAPLRQSLT